MQQSGEVVAESRALAEDGAQHVVHLAAVEPVERDFGRELGAPEIGDQTAEARGHFLASVRQRHGDALRRVAAREVEDEVERRVVGPMDILEREKHRLGAREQTDRLGQRVKESASVGVRVDGRTRRCIGKERAQLGKDGDQLCRGWLQNVCDEGRRYGASQQADEIEQRGVGDRPLRLECGAVEREESQAARIARHRAQESRLPDTCLADDEGDAASSVTRVLQQVARGSHLSVTTNDGRTDYVVSEMHDLLTVCEHPGRVNGGLGGCDHLPAPCVSRRTHPGDEASVEDQALSASSRHGLRVCLTIERTLLRYLDPCRTGHVGCEPITAGSGSAASWVTDGWWRLRSASSRWPDDPGGAVMRNLIEQEAQAPVEVAPFFAPLAGTEQPLTRRAWLGALAAIAGGGVFSVLAAKRGWASPLAAPIQRAPGLEAYVYATPDRTCCNKWMTYLRRNAFAVTAEGLDDVVPFKEKYGVPRSLWSCHTALVGNHVIEGHVPADLIEQVERDTRDIAGLSVPGMPCGAPGLEGQNPQRYQVMAFTRSGETFVYAER